MFVRIRHACASQFFYALDDPYIHLALAQRIAHGTYGINPGEPASPASSILWPFLLLPFVSLRWLVYLPLLLNLLCGAATAWLVGDALTPLGPGDRKRVALAATLAVLCVFGMNLAGLPFLGLEHSLQVLLCVFVAGALLRTLDGRRVSAACIVAAAIAPAVRYECFSLVAAVVLMLLRERRGRAAAVLACGSLVVPVSFSFYLHRVGLPLLPASVLVKAGSRHGGFVRDLVGGVVPKLANAPESLALISLTLLLLVILLRLRRIAAAMNVNAAISLCLSALLIALLQIVLGPFGWFFRYEAYAVAFALVVVCALSLRLDVLRMPLVVAVVAGCGLVYSNGMRLAPRAARDVYRQQYQMHRFATQFYIGNFAVNDLGWASFNLPRGQYVLDLFGLGSAEAQRHPARETAWLDEVTRRHDVGLVMIYPVWFKHGVPASWTPLATLCDASPAFINGSDAVVFYGTSLADTQMLLRELLRFSRTLPPGATLHVADGNTPMSCGGAANAS